MKLHVQGTSAIREQNSTDSIHANTGEMGIWCELDHSDSWSKRRSTDLISATNYELHACWYNIAVSLLDAIELWVTNKLSREDSPFLHSCS